ncbi:hypothetical protein FB45DRAFT_931951 [Roridomyces roridus]|uniref:Uncharacterized protein n=1 Tax=Roridomyces roridus TaxID=1738132 RepID=A0AAD7FE36_9AGAR|nr:hypothetical protein FB45DRAFT_931951 [Roridomyces roridus]
MTALWKPERSTFSSMTTLSGALWTLISSRSPATCPPPPAPSSPGSRPSLVCKPAYIIPYHKGDGLVQSIVQSRASAEGDASDLTQVEDIRNGMILGAELNCVMEDRRVAVVKTPQPDPCSGRHSPASQLLPSPRRRRHRASRRRRALQWLKGTRHMRSDMPNNSDAAFRQGTLIPKPSPTLLHYNYGVAALRWRGENAAKHLPGGLERRNPRGDAEMQRRAARKARWYESRGPEAKIDPWNVPLLLWARSPAGVEYFRSAAAERAREEEERVNRLEQWREGVSS